MDTWVKRKVLVPLGTALKKGLSFQKLAVSLALGITVGLIPFYGMTTILVGALALFLRLDFIVMQAVHYLVHPVQIALLIPFFKAGNNLFAKNTIDLTIKEYMSLFKTDFWDALLVYWKINASAILVWLIVAIPASYMLYKLFYFLIKKYAHLLFQRPFCKA